MISGVLLQFSRVRSQIFFSLNIAAPRSGRIPLHNG
jgi:hypothetical protein